MKKRQTADRIVEQTLSTTADAARELGVVPDTVRVMARTGRLPVAVRTKSGQRLYDPREVQRVASERRDARKQGAVSKSHSTDISEREVRK